MSGRQIQQKKRISSPSIEAGNAADRDGIAIRTGRLASLQTDKGAGMNPGLGMAVGYIVGIVCIPKLMSQVKALRICTWVAVIDSVLILVTPPSVSVWCVAFLSLACSLMYPAIWPLAITDLGKFTKKGSSLLVACIGGGAVIPLLFGLMKDLIGSQMAYWICLPFYLLIMYYSYLGYRIRK